MQLFEINAIPKLLLFLLLFLLLLSPLSALAGVHMPTGEYREQAVDLQVKVRGGVVRVERSWQADDLNRGVYRWHPNPAWDDLRFEMDVIDGVPKTILRSGARFERGGNGVYIWQQAYFIRAERDGAGAITGWRWYDRLGNWIDYDATGRIQAYGDRNGATVHFERDGEGRLARLLDAEGEAILSYHWSADQIARITDRAGRSVHYHYQGGQLVRVTDVLGHDWHYQYSGSLLSRITDPEGRSTQISYAGNRAVRVTDALGQGVEYSYDYDRVKREYRVVIRSPEGRRSERRYDRDGILLEEQIGDRTTYRLRRDARHVEIAIDERGGRTRTVYDADRNPVHVTYPDGSQTHSRYAGNYQNLLSHTDARGVETRYDYDAQGRLIRQIEAAGLPEQRITEYRYDQHGQRTGQTLKGARPEEDRHTGYRYDRYGNLSQITDPEGHVTTYSHHVSGAILSATDALGHTWRHEVDAAGRLTAQHDPLGHSQRIEYDKVGNRIRQTDAEGHITQYRYDALNRPIESIDAEGHSQHTRYSPDGQRLSTTDADGAATVYAYDSDGRLISITDPVGNAIGLEYGSADSGLAGLLTAMQYPTWREEYRYDARGRRTQTHRLLPATASAPATRLIQRSGYDPNGNRIADTDPAERSTLYRYDALNRLIKTTDAQGQTTAYGYDPQDNLTTVTDGNGHTHRFSYDKKGQLRTETRPGGATIRYAYDAVGRLTERTSPGGERREYSHDAAGRKTAERHYPQGSATPSQTIAYHYDGNNRLTGYTQSGDTHSAARYRYNARGQKTEESHTYGEGATAFSLSTHTAYDAVGRKQRFTYPDGSAIDYRYSAAGQLESASLPDGQAIHWKTYHWQQPTRIEMPGAVRRLTYDALQRPIHIQSQAIGQGSPEAPSGDLIMDYRYSYDAAGNITQRQTEDGAYRYAYDQIDRLTQAAPPANLQRPPTQPQPGQLPLESYHYDAAHNRIASLHQPGQWHYNADNQLQSYGLGAERHTYAYTPNGHTATETRGEPPTHTRHFIYNAAERLSQITDNGQTTARYAYDPLGRRIQKQTPTQTTWYLYSDEGLIAELDQTGQPTRYYGWKPDSLWSADPLWLADKTTASPDAWKIHLYHTDHLGAPQRLTDPQGQTQWSARTEAFGQTHITLDAINNPLRFPGQYHDVETDLHHNWHRDYNPNLGRYIQSDPIGLEGGVNVYGYVNASPLELVDEEGLSAFPTNTYEACVRRWGPRNCGGEGPPSPRPKKKPKKKKGYKVYCRCNIIKQSPCDDRCPDTIGGRSDTMITEMNALKDCELSAKQNLSSLGVWGCQTKHCHAIACFKDGAPIPCSKWNPS